MNAGVNCLGPGNWANASIGRAVRLALQNIGGGTPGEMDRASQGQPGKYAFCCAENESASPWEPLHVERGYDREQSTVTVVAAAGTLNFNSHTHDARDLLRVLADTIANPDEQRLLVRRGAVDHRGAGARADPAPCRLQQSRRETRALGNARSCGPRASRRKTSSVRNSRVQPSSGRSRRTPCCRSQTEPGLIGLVVARSVRVRTSVYVPRFRQARARVTSRGRSRRPPKGDSTRGGAKMKMRPLISLLACAAHGPSPTCVHRTRSIPPDRCASSYPRGPAAFSTSSSACSRRSSRRSWARTS